MQTDAEVFKRVYRHAFVLAKESPDQRAVPLDNAMVYWQCFFGEDQAQGKPWVTRGGPLAGDAGTTDWFTLWSDYLKTNWTRTVSKDMWNQTLVFALKTLADPTLGFWTPDGAWPSVIDNFVEWVRKKQGAPAAGATMEVDS
jgi:DCN1-like protein 1/2